MFEFPSGGNIPVRSQGSRWITHKRKGLQRILDRYGAYMCHLTALSEDSSLKSEDRARITGYTRKWSDAKILIGCAIYIEVLKPSSVLSLTLQNTHLDIVFAMKQLLKTCDTLKSLKQLDPLQWPTVKLVIDRLEDDGDEKTYQGAVLKNYSSEMIEFCKKEALADMKQLEENIRQRLEWSDVKLLRAVLVFIETQSWIKSAADDEYEDSSMLAIKLALEDIFRAFADPLEASNVNLSTLQDEIEDVVDYARKYLSIESTSYRKVWYLLHVCPDIKKWPGILLLCELVFSLPFSNGRVEQIFSSLKLIKTKNRTNLLTSTLDDLLEICIEGPSLSSFIADGALDLWWSDCRTTRRPNQKREPYRPRSATPSTNADSQEQASDSDSNLSPALSTILDDWDNLFL